MPLYENGVIYKLKHNLDYDDLNIYIGSTTNFRGRKNCHKNNCYNEKSKKNNIPIYQFIRDNGGWVEWVMIAIEEYPCDSKKKLETRERYYIDLLRPTLNKIIPTRTKKEYYEVNKEKLAEYQKERYENNKEIILEKHKEYREANKEQIKEQSKEYREANKEKIKEYRKANKEIINEIQKKYYENNKEKIYEKVICDNCGCEITKNHLKRHQKTKKCINFKNITPLVDE